MGVGVVKPEGNSCIYIVSSVSDLVNVILPIFTSFPLLSSKKLDLSDFVAAINLKLPYASSLPVNVYNQILNLKKSMNTGRTTYMSPTIVNYDSIDKFWLLGFVKGDGTFAVKNGTPFFQNMLEVKI